jgi:hypothetical protein
MSADDHPTPLSQQAAEPADPPPKSWHGPVRELRQDVDAIKATVEKHVASIDVSLASLVAQATKDPTVRRHLLSILGSVAVILSIVAAALAGRASSTPPAPAPAPAITVVVPKEAHS